MRATSTLAFALCVAAAAPGGSAGARAQAPTPRRDYGSEWRSLDLQNHLLYVAGLQQGSAAVVDVLAELGGVDAPGDSAVRAQWERLALNGRQRRVMRAVVERQGRFRDIGRFGTRAVCRVVDDLYADPANTFIPWIDVVDVALLRLRGGSDADVADQLRRLRGAAAATPPAQP